MTAIVSPRRDVAAEARALLDASHGLRLEPTALVDDAPHTADDGLPYAVCAVDLPPEEPVEIRAGIMTAGDYGLFAGEDGVMKTTLALLLAGALAGGYRFLRFDTIASPVLIVSEEDSAAVLVNRLEAMCRGNGWNRDAVLSNVYLFARQEIRLTDVAWQARLLGEIHRIRPALVVLDPLSELMTGDENSNSEARAVVQTIRSLSGPSGASVLAVHHFGKASDGKSAGDRIRGASAIRRAARFTYIITHDEAAHELKVTNLKFSRGEILPPFVVRYYIDADPANRAVWKSARFESVSLQAAILDRAETFVLEQLDTGDRMNTTELKTAAKGTGVSGADISRVIKSLEMRRLIDFTEGAKGAKQWGRVCLPSDSRQPRQPEIVLAGQPECLPGNQHPDSFCLPSPFRGKQEQAGTLSSADDKLPWED